MRTLRCVSCASLLAAICLLGLLTLVGCGPKLPATAPVTGTVLHGGKAIEGATVIFARGGRDIAKGELALGKTDAQGRFTLTTHLAGQTEVKGVMPGQYEVTVSKRVPPKGISESKYKEMVDAANKIGETGAMVPPDKQPPETVELFPPKYSMLGKTELKADVKEAGPNDFEFKLD